MREIRFRAWDKKNKKMVQPVSLWNYGNGVWFDALPSDYIPMQFTGLKDKNGKEIYEGDILQDSPTYKGVCKYSSEKASFYIDRNEFGTGGKGHLSTEMEVIGNVWENPDLLKEMA